MRGWEVAAAVLALVLAYAWVLYPAIVVSVRRPRRASPGGNRYPLVAVILSAHNEEQEIAARLRNLEELAYPRDRILVYVGVDGSSDRTAELAQAWAAQRPGAHVHVSRKRRGKAAMLKDLVRMAEAGASALLPDRPAGQLSLPFDEVARPDLLVFTDANTAFDSAALARLVVPFGEPSVGGACGRLILVSPGARAAGRAETRETSYWDLESRLKEAESAIDSCLGANGAIYACRRGLFWAGLPDNTIVDDFVIGMKIREQGSRMVFVPDAVAREEVPPLVADEWRRRVRIGAGAFQALGLCRRCLRPELGRFAWMLWSHKVLRWVTPHLTVALFAFCLAGLGPAASNRAAAAWCAAALGGLAAAGAAGLLARRARAGWLKPLQAWGYFAAMQAALFVGFLRFCRGNLSGAWARTART